MFYFLAILSVTTDDFITCIMYAHYKRPFGAHVVVLLLVERDIANSGSVRPSVCPPHS